MSEASDVVDLVTYAWARHRSRMAGLTDEEWAWLPTGDQRLGLRWRLDHIAETLSDSRNSTWLPGGGGTPPSRSAPPAAAPTAGPLSAPRNSTWLGVGEATLVAGSAPSAADALECGERAVAAWCDLLL